MKQRIPAIVTMVLIAAAFAALTQRERLTKWMRAEKPVSGPEDVVWLSSDAAGRGDVRAYLDCFAGPLGDRLRRAASDMGESQFSEYLTKLNRELTGIAVSDLELSNDDTAALRVEFVYRGRSEVQKHGFRLIDGAWKIVDVGEPEWLRGILPPAVIPAGR